MRIAKAKGSAKTGGRKKGIPNKATASVKALAQNWGPESIEILAEMAGLVKGKTPVQSEAARIAAIGMLLDRGYGKPTQTIAGDADNPLHHVVSRTVDGPPDETREEWLARRKRELGSK